MARVSVIQTESINWDVYLEKMIVVSVADVTVATVVCSEFYRWFTSTFGTKGSPNVAVVWDACPSLYWLSYIARMLDSTDMIGSRISAIWGEAEIDHRTAADLLRIEWPGELIEALLPEILGLT